MLFLAATMGVCVTVINSAQSQQAKSSSVKLGEAMITELKPTVIEVKQFTTKWVNEILAANGEKQ